MGENKVAGREYMSDIFYLITGQLGQNKLNFSSRLFHWQSDIIMRPSPLNLIPSFSNKARCRS